MLREYIANKIREKEDIVIDLENDIKKLKREKKNISQLIKILEDENNDGSEIFSPRNHREQNINRLNHYHEEMDQVVSKIEDMFQRLENTKKKVSEYESMLKEAEMVSQESAQKYSNKEVNEIISGEDGQESPEKEISSAVSPDSTQKYSDGEVNEIIPGEDGQEGSKKEINSAVSSDNTQECLKDEACNMAQNVNGIDKEEAKESSEGPSDQELLRKGISLRKSIEEGLMKKGLIKEYSENETAPDTELIGKISEEKLYKNVGISDKEDELELADERTDESGYAEKVNNIEIKSGELIVLESERKKEKEFLSKVKKNIELCLSCTGSKNKCKNELKKIRKMIDDYVVSIEI